MLFAYMKAHDVPIDDQNSDCCRYTRLPGVMRDGKLQHLIDTNIGAADWDSWARSAGLYDSENSERTSENKRDNST